MTISTTPHVTTHAPEDWTAGDAATASGGFYIRAEMGRMTDEELTLSVGVCADVDEWTDAEFARRAGLDS